MIFVFYILAALLIYFSFKSFRGGTEYLKYFREELERPPSNFVPHVSVIVPCKGLDQGLKENLAALLAQDYPEYEVIFVVDAETDPAVPVIRSLSNDLKLIVASKAVVSSQKIENLREAVLHTGTGSEVFVFADSDARPTEGWLRHLVAPLCDESIGVATGYRWFISPRPSFASELRSVWNASIASSLGPGRNNQFCWGGGMAIRRATFEYLGVREKWQGTVSDDFVLARTVRDAELSIRFVPQALTASLESCTFREMFEFTTRQMKLTRVYQPHLWRLSFFGSGLFIIVMTASILIAAFSGWGGIATLAALFTIISVSIFSVGKSWLRLKAVALALPEHRESLRKQFLPQITLWLVTPALFFANCTAAFFSRRIVWRGFSYLLVSPTRTVVTPQAEYKLAGRRQAEHDII